MYKTISKLHRWVGAMLVAYVALICLTGAFLVYRVELYQYFDKGPVTVEVGLTRLSDEELLQSAREAFPAEVPLRVWHGEQPNHAIEIQLDSHRGVRGYLFDPYTGKPLRPAQPLGVRATETLLKIHSELLGGEGGRLANGALALSFIFLAFTGLMIWKPQKSPRQRFRQTSGSRAGMLRRLHIRLGSWVAVFLLIWGISGLHLVYPQIVDHITDYIEPFNEMNPVERVGDWVAHWLSLIHFGRFGGRLPGCGRGWCDQTLKAVWASIALIPVFLGGSGLFLSLRRIKAKRAMKRRRAFHKQR